MASLKVLFLVANILVLQTFLEARYISHEESIKEKVQEARNILDVMERRHMVVVYQMDDGFIMNYTAITEHGDAAGSYLLRNLALEVYNLQAEARDHGVDFQNCVDEFSPIIEGLPSTTNDHIETLKTDILAEYKTMYEYVTNLMTQAESRLKEIEQLMDECNSNEECLETVLTKTETLEEYIKKDFVKELRSKVEDILRKMYKAYHSAEGYYLDFYDAVQKTENDLIQCYEDLFP